MWRGSQCGSAARTRGATGSSPETERLAAREREITGGAGGAGARVAFDPVAGALLPQLADALALGGIVIEYGALAAEQAPFPLFAVLGKRLSVHGYQYKRVGGDPAKLDAATRFVLDGLASGALKPTLDRVFPLDRIAHAHRYPESNEQFGAIAVTV
ncbi:zinc-binding dehydrogenase [Burkholderia pseudomallei]|uniref:zinc-binding dehydrogenase n=1 Tax=Burkholderia pseudomallei TaxID=28450 RepID=UPI001E2EBE0C|nr:zinc-binding dehydrogenase [Burkholderia pseudomallei]